MNILIRPEIPLPNVQLVETDGEKLESPWHQASISLLLDSVTYWYRDRTDFYVGGNMFIYYSVEQARNRDYRGPDFFYVNGVNRLPVRPYWAVWEEGGKYPDLIIELLSPTTAEEDRTTKRVLYERTFHTHEYYCYDPTTHQVQGWRLTKKHRYRTIRPNEQGELWSEELGLWLTRWHGEYLSITDTFPRFREAHGPLVPFKAEAAEQQLMQALQRATTMEAELAQLKARLAELEKRAAEPPSS
jgi:Uma2 family endonuclease